MQLNKTHKATIAVRIMDDVPKIDYPKIIREYVQATAAELMPPEVRAIYDNEATRPYLACQFLVVSGTSCPSPGAIYWRRKSESATCHYETLYLNRPHWHGDLDPLTDELLKKVHKDVLGWVNDAEKQAKERSSMHTKLNTMLKGIRTLKQAKTLLEPELHRYLPEEPPKDPALKAAQQASTALVPYVVANLREMGWPKDQEPSTMEGAN
jgi:hypothetical protein